MSNDCPAIYSTSTISSYHNFPSHHHDRSCQRAIPGVYEQDYNDVIKAVNEGLCSSHRQNRCPLLMPACAHAAAKCVFTATTDSTAGVGAPQSTLPSSSSTSSKLGHCDVVLVEVRVERVVEEAALSHRPQTTQSGLGWVIDQLFGG